MKHTFSKISMECEDKSIFTPTGKAMLNVNWIGPLTKITIWLWIPWFLWVAYVLARTYSSDPRISFIGAIVLMMIGTFLFAICPLLVVAYVTDVFDNRYRDSLFVDLLLPVIQADTAKKEDLQQDMSDEEIVDKCSTLIDPDCLNRGSLVDQFMNSDVFVATRLAKKLVEQEEKNDILFEAVTKAVKAQEREGKK